MAMTMIDFGRAAHDYGQHRRGFPDKLFQRLERINVTFAGVRALDLGTGTGTLARALARRGALVTGLDRSMQLMNEARLLDGEAHVEVEYVEGRAEDTGLAAHDFDLISAGQCWWWFDESATLREIERLLKPAGRLLLASFDWLPLPGNVVEATERLIERHNEDWTMGGGDGLHVDWIRSLSRFGFEDLESFSFDVIEPYSHEGWRGRIRASAGVGASLSSEGVERFDHDLATLLTRHYPGEPLDVPHRVFAVTGRLSGRDRR